MKNPTDGVVEMMRNIANPIPAKVVLVPFDCVFLKTKLNVQLLTKKQPYRFKLNLNGLMNWRKRSESEEGNSDKKQCRG